MRIEKWGFLLSYAIYLVFCMGFSLISKDNEDEELGDSTQDLLNKQEKKEVIYYVIASSIAVFGLIALLIVLTLRISVTSYVNSTLTIIAFFFVIINLILKDYYKANSVKTLEEEKKKLFKDLRENNEN